MPHYASDDDEARFQQLRDEHTLGTPDHALIQQEHRDEIKAERKLAEWEIDLIRDRYMVPFLYGNF